LLKAGADKEAKNKDQETPLHVAARRGHADTVNALLKAGANVNAVDDNGKTPSMLGDEKIKAIFEDFARSKAATQLAK
jgi:cytohesin